MSFLAWLLETAIAQAIRAWWNRDKTQEAIDASNKVDAMPDDAVRKRLRLWTRD